MVLPVNVAVAVRSAFNSFFVAYVVVITLPEASAIAACAFATPVELSVKVCRVATSLTATSDPPTLIVPAVEPVVISASSTLPSKASCKPVVSLIAKPVTETEPEPVTASPPAANVPGLTDKSVALAGVAATAVIAKSPKFISMHLRKTLRYCAFNKPRAVLEYLIFEIPLYCYYQKIFIILHSFPPRKKLWRG